MIDRMMAEQHLAEAEIRVALGRTHISQQTRIVSELEDGDHDATQARRLLTTFEDLQVQHEAHRDRLLEELHRVQ